MPPAYAEHKPRPTPPARHHHRPRVHHRRRGRDKLAAGMKILIREGSAARNYRALEELIDEYPDRLMFCTDDCHPDDLLAGHINRLVIRAVRGGATTYTMCYASPAATPSSTTASISASSARATGPTSSRSTTYATSASWPPTSTAKKIARRGRCQPPARLPPRAHQ